MNILAISGALRRGSTNTALLRALQALAPEDMKIEIATLHGIAWRETLLAFGAPFRPWRACNCSRPFSCSW